MNNTPEMLERILKEIIDDWYMHLEEYPYLHEYLAASLVKNGIVKNEGAVNNRRAG